MITPDTVILTSYSRRSSRISRGANDCNLAAIKGGDSTNKISVTKNRNTAVDKSATRCVRPKRVSLANNASIRRAQVTRASVAAEGRHGVEGGAIGFNQISSDQWNPTVINHTTFVISPVGVGLTRQIRRVATIANCTSNNRGGSKGCDRGINIVARLVGREVAIIDSASRKIRPSATGLARKGGRSAGITDRARHGIRGPESCGTTAQHIAERRDRSTAIPNSAARLGCPRATGLAGKGSRSAGITSRA